LPFLEVSNPAFSSFVSVVYLLIFTKIYIRRIIIKEKLKIFSFPELLKEDDACIL